jgi:hypothetical protein
MLGGVIRLVLVVAVLAVTGAARAAPAPYVLHGDTSVGGLRIARADLADARARFGAPSATRRVQVECVATWRRIGLTLAFLELSGGDPCRAGALVRATITSRADWRTAKGLRKGDSVARLRALYPRARYRGHIHAWTGYWLVTRRACELGGFEPFPGLLARVRDGRVTALVAATTACE